MIQHYGFRCCLTRCGGSVTPFPGTKRRTTKTSAIAAPALHPLPRLQLPSNVVLMFSRDFLKGFKKLASSGFSPLLEWKDGNLPGRSPGYEFALECLQPSNRWDFLFRPDQRSRPSTSPLPISPYFTFPQPPSLSQQSSCEPLPTMHREEIAP